MAGEGLWGDCCQARSNPRGSAAGRAHAPSFPRSCRLLAWRSPPCTGPRLPCPLHDRRSAAPSAPYVLYADADCAG